MFSSILRLWVASSLLLILGSCVTRPRGAGSSPPRILMVGDSWPVVLLLHKGFPYAYSQRGYELNQVRNVAVGWKVLQGGTGGATADPKLTAKEYNSEEYRQRARDAIKRWPSIKVIHVTLGGSDMCRALGRGVAPEDLEEMVRDEIMSDVGEVIDFLKAEFPERYIALVGYDYVNIRDYIGEYFKAKTRWKYIGSPTDEMLNRHLAMLNRYHQALARDRGIVFINSMGRTKERFGVPHDPSEPPPKEGLWIDGVHLSKSSNIDLAHRCLDIAYDEWIGPLKDGEGRPLFRAPAESVDAAVGQHSSAEEPTL